MFSNDYQMGVALVVPAVAGARENWAIALPARRPPAELSRISSLLPRGCKFAAIGCNSIVQRFEISSELAILECGDGVKFDHKISVLIQAKFSRFQFKADFHLGNKFPQFRTSPLL